MVGYSQLVTMVRSLTLVFIAVLLVAGWYYHRKGSPLGRYYAGLGVIVLIGFSLLTSLVDAL